MKLGMITLIGLAFASPALAAAPESTISIKDIGSFERQLSEMGYAPEPFDTTTKTPTTTIAVNGGKLAIVLGGCKNNKDCTYVVAGGLFSDVVRPPADWVERQNRDYDLIKVSVNEDGYLSYVSSAMVEGLPRSTFRAWIDQVDNSSADLGQLAKKDGHVKP